MLAISGIVDVVAGYIGTLTLFPPALIILEISIVVGALAEIGSTAIEELIDSPDVDTLKCIIRCHASEDGAFTASEFANIQDDVNEQIDEPTRTIMAKWLDSYGPVGLTRAAAANGITEGDCGDCDCDNIISLTYFGGTTGPATAHIGENFVVTPASFSSDGGYSIVSIVFSHCVNLTWLAGSVTLSPGHSVDAQWYVGTEYGGTSCGTETTVTYSSSTDADEVNIQQGVSHAGNNFSSRGQESRPNVTLRIDSLV